ncbi:GPI ethanolamine phosphate transferase 1 [Camellia lanceoleosa]|uniref:GPI ethanolamine phosphate transferase 1 n=1 Tax=Camellia lanceoleosa TaxID=1840588 RepID=A0ACC0IT86_9ERIC|nr:GPI ethanolamine phosphate transferase 1 [Camellia lanceoleosa]
MGGGDGILGVRGGAAARSAASSSSTERRNNKWLKRRETWLVVLGVVLHAVYMLSIFDIYFKTPIVHGMDPVPPRFSAPPAKRLFLFVADGLRADKFFEPDSEGNYRAPFLRSVIKGQGRWGVSHARPPTESRPGHVSIIAGFYEDPSAVTKGWKANPVEFDSVFNRSRHTFAFGSPDIVPIFCSALPHSTWNSYPHEFEDFATDPKLKQLLLQDNLVVFLHLLGCDSNGHAHRPYSSIYLNNVKVVGHIAERVYNLVENYFKDNRTSYIFTADHGMSDKGSHGDGHNSNTDTPLVAWGAGVKHPMPMSSNNHSDCGVRFIDEHMHDMPTPAEWGLDGVERVDVNQADIAPLMSTLLGLPCPVNSVGNLPLDYINLNEAEEVEAVLANTKQILNQFLRKSLLKQSNSLNFKPFKPLVHYSSILDQIEHLISFRDYEAAMKLSQNLRSLALKGLNYFQTYDWFMLMTVVTLGYIGWMIYLILHVLQSYASLPGKFSRKEQALHLRNNSGMVYLCGCLFMGSICILLLLEHSPPLYHVYATMTVFLWTKIFSEYQFLKAIWRDLRRRQYSYIIALVVTCAVSVVILEFLVHSFTERKLYTWCFLIVGITASIHLYYLIPWKSGIPIFVWSSCWFLSIFTLMPAEIPDNTLLVVASGAMIIAIGGVATYLDLHAEANKYWHGLLNHDLKKPKFPMLFSLQALLVGLSSVMVPLSTSHRTQKQELLVLHQLINWSTAAYCRLTSIFLGFAPTFLLLSIGYEAVFYAALGLALMAWILYENTLLYRSKMKTSSTSIKSVEDSIILENDVRGLQLSDMRIPLTFMVLFNLAFLEQVTMSIASFEISSVYRFITIFSPFLMAALLIFKLFIPFMLVICTFSALTKLIRVSRLGCYFLVILCSDVMTIHFFFLVRTTGSWMEIGNSISHFGIVSAQVVFVLLLFALTNIYERYPTYISSTFFSESHLAVFSRNLQAKAEKTNQASTTMFSSGEELGNLVLSSDLLHYSWAAILEAYKDTTGTANPNDPTTFPISIKYRVDRQQSPHVLQYQSINCHRTLYRGIHCLSLHLMAARKLVSKGCLQTPSMYHFWFTLIGDNGFQQAISERPIWNSSFLHVASNQDPIPKLFASPHDVLNIEPTSHASVYKPFGTFLLCSESGCACFEEPESVLDLMVAISSDGGPNEGLQIIDYGHVLERLKHGAIYQGISKLGIWNGSPPQTGIVIQIEAIKVGRTQQRHENGDINSLVTKVEKRAEDLVARRRNVFDPKKKLNDMKISMIYLEWSKKRRKCPKRRGLSFALDFYAATNYRRMIEPLDIAEFYRKGKKDYLAERSEHYKLLEQWVKDDKQEGRQSNANERKSACSLTEDSCFWVHVEEAMVLCNLLKDGGTSPEGKVSLMENLVKFENYVMDLIKNYAVSTEIFFNQSSFMKWWAGYENITGSLLLPQREMFLSMEERT